MKVLNHQGSIIKLDRGFRFGYDFFKLLNFIKYPNDKDSDRNSIEAQCETFYRDIMNYGFVDSHNQHLKDGRYDLAAKNLNEINNLSLDPLTELRKKEYLKRKITSLENDIYLDVMSDFSLIICDLDKFKTINDSFGHSIGDDTLKLFGKLVLENLRANDFAYRYGGEEFLFLLPDTRLAEAAAIAERIRLAIDERLLIGHYGLNQITAYDSPKSLISPIDENKDINTTFFLSKDVTSSFGVANYLECGQSSDELFSRADENLYHAKKQGRNKVVYKIPLFSPVI